MLGRLTTAQSIVATIAALTVLSADAVAQQARPASSPKQHARPAQPKEAVAPREAGEPVMAIVSIKSQQVTLYDADGWILRAPVSTGVKERETPAGIFAVVEKKEDHRSNMYDDAHMPHMHRITWNGIALHGGPLPGYAASHGCVRLPFGFAEKIFGKTRLGMRVIISPNDAAPVEVSHPALLVPNAEALAAAPARAEPLAREAVEAATAADEAKKAAATAVRETASRAASLRKLEQAKARADAELARAEKALAAAKTDQAKASAEETQQKAAAKAAEATTQLETARAEAKSKADPAAVKEAAKAAETKKAAAAKAALEAKLALEPVSIYISRATSKLYVRRNTHKPAPDGGGFGIRLDHRGSGRDPRCGQADRHACVHRGGERWCGPALDRGHDRRGGCRQERARPHHHPEGCARPHRADRVAAIFDRHLGRAAERGNQLPNRVRRGAEQPAAGRLHHARAYADGCGERSLQRRRTLVFPTRLGRSNRSSGEWRARSDWRAAQRGPATRSSARLGLPIWQFRLVRRSVFSPGAATLVIGAGTPRAVGY